MGVSVREFMSSNVPVERREAALKQPKLLYPDPSIPSDA
jgi:hypothetical protein